MGHGDADRPPYRTAWRLVHWAFENWNDLDGRFLLAGYTGGVGDLDVRQLCNAAYSAMVEWADEKERAKIDRELAAVDPGTLSHGTDALLALMGGPR